MISGGGWDEDVLSVVLVVALLLWMIVVVVVDKGTFEYGIVVMLVVVAVVEGSPPFATLDDGVVVAREDSGGCVGRSGCPTMGLIENRASSSERLFKLVVFLTSTLAIATLLACSFSPGLGSSMRLWCGKRLAKWSLLLAVTWLALSISMAIRGCYLSRPAAPALHNRRQSLIGMEERTRKWL